jgi:glycosyltransferase involved in cell wall biosynthesis
MVVELGSVPYQQLHQLYSQCDIYVTPAYTETFAHPLVEAMSSGLPIVASDISVHREICGSAAVYFPRFSAPELAERVSQLVALPPEMKRMAALGLQRSHLFSWDTHVEQILELVERLVVSRHAKS